MVSAPAANQGEGEIGKVSVAPLDYDGIVQQIVQDAVAQYPSAEALGLALAAKEGIRGYGGHNPYSKQVIRKWARGENPVPGPVLLAICHLTGQSLDTPLGLAQELEADVDRLLAEVRELQLAIGRLHRSRKAAPVKPRGRGT